MNKVIVTALLALSLTACNWNGSEGAPDDGKYPGKDECFEKNGNYDYDGWDGSWSCDLPDNGLGLNG